MLYDGNKVLAYRHKANLDVKGAKAPTYRSGVIYVFVLIIFAFLVLLDVSNQKTYLFDIQGFIKLNLHVYS